MSGSGGGEQGSLIIQGPLGAAFMQNLAFGAFSVNIYLYSVQRQWQVIFATKFDYPPTWIIEWQSKKVAHCQSREQNYKITVFCFSKSAQNPYKITVYFFKITKSQNLLFKIRTRECLVRFLDPHYVHSQSGNRTSECQTNYFNAFCPF